MRLILAILLAGFGIFAQSPAQRQATVLGQPPAWTPAQLGTSLELWLDAADSSTITLNGSTVSAWADKSGNLRHATQSNASLQPSYAVAGFNTKPSIQFDQKYLENTTAQFPLISRSVFVVVNETTRVTNAGLFVAKTGTTNDYDNPRGYSISTGGVASQIDITGSSSVSYRLNPTPGIASSGIFGEIKQAGSGTLFKNGTSIATDSSFTEFDSISNGGYLLGARFLSTAINYTTLGLKGDISEVVYVGSTLSTTDRQKLEGYLAWKWALQDNLPLDHPYKSRRPAR